MSTTEEAADAAIVALRHLVEELRGHIEFVEAENARLLAEVRMMRERLSYG